MLLFFVCCEAICFKTGPFVSAHCGYLHSFIAISLQFYKTSDSKLELLENIALFTVYRILKIKYVKSHNEQYCCTDKFSLISEFVSFQIFTGRISGFAASYIKVLIISFDQLCDRQKSQCLQSLLCLQYTVKDLITNTVFKNI